ncbi:MAG: AraC family transcriptional regulator [Desulfobacteraceae bacterium]
MKIHHMTTDSFAAAIPDGRENDNNDSFRLVFCLNGLIQVRFHLKGRVREKQIPEGYFDLHDTLADCRLEYCAQTKAEALLVSVSRHRLMHFIADQALCREFNEVVERAAGKDRIIQITPAVDRLVRQIIHPICPGCGVHLFYLAKILELVSTLLPSARPVPDVHSPGDISLTDRHIVEQTMARLEGCMDNPPSIKELAVQAGVSTSKFKQLFPKACGMTPYEYLRKIRMEKALYLLCQGRMNVTEAAYEVGYESISHFSKVFFKFHGIKPSVVRRTGFSQ